jgi:hypothetical protein
MEVSNVTCSTISHPAELIALKLRELREFRNCQSVHIHIQEVYILAASNFLYESAGLCR